MLPGIKSRCAASTELSRYELLLNVAVIIGSLVGEFSLGCLRPAP
jgi:hypothetical protein